MSIQDGIGSSAGMYSASIPSTRRTVDSLQSSQFSLSTAWRPPAQGLQDIVKTVQNLNLEFYPHSEIQRGEPIGEGETFWVEKCEFRQRTMAIKRLKISSDSRDEFIRRIRSVLLELQIMHHGPLRSHPNILTLLGYGWNTSGGNILPYILVDYCPGGNLRQYLIAHKLPGNNWTFGGLHREANRQKELFMADIAVAIQALHTTGIIHGDLKLENVLVSNFDDRRRSPIARVCDFGHSIVKGSSEEGKASGSYRGTARYNAPEVFHRKERLFDQMELKKCDIWAFGILAWEILLDGSSYMSQLAVEKSERLESKPGEDGKLLVTALPSTRISLDPIQRAIFKDVLRRTLQYHPHERVGQLDILLIMKKWRATGITDLQAQLALHSGTSEWSYEIFRHDNHREIFWIHKSHIAEDFLSAFEDQSGDKSVQASAAWQLGCCHATGFGVSKDWANAEMYFKHAAQMGSQVAQDFGLMLLEQGSSHEGDAYLATIRRIFCPDEIPAKLIFDERQKRITIQTVTSQSLSRNDKNLDTGIAKRYAETIKAMKVHPWLQLHYEEPPIIQALRARNWRAVQELIAWGIPSGQEDKSGRNMFHWLFMIDDDVATFAEHMMTQRNEINLDALDKSASQSLSVDPQWPLRLHGTPLMHAISTGSRNTVAALLKLGADPLAPSHTQDDVRSEILWTAFHTAIEYFDVDTLEILQKSLGEFIKASRWPKEVHLGLSEALCSATLFERIAMHGRNVNRRLERIIQMSWSPAIAQNFQTLAPNVLPLIHESALSSLILSLDNDDLDVSEALLVQNIDLAKSRRVFGIGNSKTSFTYPIHNAIQMASSRDDPNALRAVELVLKYDPTGLSRLDGSGRSCLHIAAAGLSVHLIDFVAERKPALLDANDRQGARPLHYCESTQTLERLVSLGSHINASDDEGRSPLVYAVSKGLGDIVNDLCRMEANIDAPDGSPWNPLHIAIIQLKSNIATTLIGYGAKVNTPNTVGDTPLHLAARKSSRYEVQLLLDKNADISARNKLGQFPLHIAAAWNNLAVVELLSACMPQHILADEDTAEDAEDVRLVIPRSPFFICAERSYTEAMHAMLLLLSKEDVEKEDRYQRNVLHYAAAIKSGLLILHLGTMGMDMNPSDDHEDTPLLVCLQSSFPGSTLEAFEALLDSGASLDSHNVEGEFAWDIAFSQGRVDVLTYLLSRSALACQNVTLAQHLSKPSRTPRTSEVTELVTSSSSKDFASSSIGNQRRVTVVKRKHERRCCKKDLVQLGIETSNTKLLLAFKFRIQSDEPSFHVVPPGDRWWDLRSDRDTKEKQENRQILNDLQHALERLKSDPWARLGEPTSEWLSTGWLGRDPQFERYVVKPVRFFDLNSTMTDPLEVAVVEAAAAKRTHTRKSGEGFHL